MTSVRAVCVAAMVVWLGFASEVGAVTAASPTAWYRVTNYPSIQAAIDSCAANGGGVVYFPPGTYVLPSRNTTLRLYPQAGSSGPWQRLHGITLMGDGPDVCTIQGPPGVHDTLLRVMRDNTLVQGLTFSADPGDSTSEADVVLGDDTNADHVLKYTRFRDVYFAHAGRYCVRTTDAPYIGIIGDFESCRFLGNASSVGALVRIGTGSTTYHFRNCVFGPFRRTAVYLDGAQGVTLTECVFEGELDNSGPFVYATRSADCSISSAWFEDDADGDGLGLGRDQWFVQLDKRCHGFMLSGGTFMRDGASVRNPRQPKVLQVLGTKPGDESIGVMAINLDMAVQGVVDSTRFNYVDIASNLSEVYLLGGGLRDSLAYRRVVVSDTDRLMTFGGTRTLKLMRLPDATISTLPATEQGRLVFNKNTNRLNFVNGTGWTGSATGAR